MDPIDLIRDKFSQDCTVDTVLHLLMAHFDLTKEEAQAKIDEYFEIVEGYSNMPWWRYVRDSQALLGTEKGAVKLKIWQKDKN